jgi:hypothetical protein
MESGLLVLLVLQGRTEDVARRSIDWLHDHGCHALSWAASPFFARICAQGSVSVFNFALGSWDLKPSLPKAFVPAQRNLEHILRKQNVDGYLVFFSINICRNNTDDVRKLTDYAHAHRIATDYHINETPMLEQDDHFKHLYDWNGAGVNGNGHQAELLASTPGLSRTRMPSCTLPNGIAVQVRTTNHSHRWHSNSLFPDVRVNI